MSEDQEYEDYNDHSADETNENIVSSNSNEQDDLDSMRLQLSKLEDEKFNQIKDIGISNSNGSNIQSESGPEVDARSIYVGNVDYSVTPDDLQNLFKSCGAINRITILCDKLTGHPKGFAYVEFADPESVASSLLLNNQEIKGRALKVVSKRTNKPASQRGIPRGRGAGGRGRGRGNAFGPVYGMPQVPYGFYPPPFAYPPRGRGGGNRGAFRARYAPPNK